MADQMHFEVDRKLGIKSKNKTFNWNKEVEKNLLLTMINLKPIGIQKHLNILLIQENIKEKYDIAIPTSLIWEYLNLNYDMENPNVLKNLHFDNIQKSLSLSSYPAEIEIINKHVKLLSQSLEKEREILKLYSNVSTLPKSISNSTSKIEYKDKNSKKSLSVIDHREKIEVNIDEPTQIEVSCKNLRKTRQTENLKNKKKMKIYNEFESTSKTIQSSETETSELMKICEFMDIPGLVDSSEEIISSVVVTETEDTFNNIVTSEETSPELHLTTHEIRLIKKTGKKYGKDFKVFLPIVHIKRFDD